MTPFMIPSTTKTFSQSTLSSNLDIIQSSHTSTSYYSSLHECKNRNASAHDTLNFITFNAFNKGQIILSDLLQLLSDLKVHIIAIQDSGKLYQTQEGRAQFGNYHIEHFQFGEGKNDTLAFIIDEGITHHIIKEIKFNTSKVARTMVLTLPKIYNGSDLHIVNTYAPAVQSQKATYVKELLSFLQQHQYTAENTFIMGDMNDFVLPEIDHWSNKPSGNKHRQCGVVLHPLRRIKFYDAFRVTHPEQIAFTRVGEYENEGVLNKKTITMTRIDYILSSFHNIQQLKCIVILDGYDVGSDHYPVIASLQVNVNIPHVASLSSIIQENNTSQAIPVQPQRKFIASNCKELWDKYADTVCNSFLQSDILTMIPQNNKEIDIWATAFTDIIDTTVQQTIEWIDQPNPLLTPKSWDNADTLQGQYVIPPTNMVSPLTLPKVLYKDKIKLDLFKKLNKLRSTINSAISLLILCVRNKLGNYTPLQLMTLEQLQCTLESNSNDVKQAWIHYDTQTYSEKPLEQQDDESDKQYEYKETDRQISRYIQKAKRPDLNMLVQQTTQIPPTELLTTLRKVHNCITHTKDELYINSDKCETRYFWKKTCKN
jgi:exonuclease III